MTDSEKMQFTIALWRIVMEGERRFLTNKEMAECLRDVAHRLDPEYEQWTNIKVTNNTHDSR